MTGCAHRWYGGVSLALAIRLMILPVFLSVIDFAITLSYQPAEYWDGDRTALVEANPIARLVLTIHPLLIIPAMIAWYVLMFPLIFKTPARFGLRVITAHIAACLVVISGWLIRMHDHGWPWLTLLVGGVLLTSIAVMIPFRGQWNSPRPVHL